MIDRPQYESQALDHLGLVAGMFDELGIGDVLDQAIYQDPIYNFMTSNIHKDQRGHAECRFVQSFWN